MSLPPHKNNRLFSGAMVQYYFLQLRLFLGGIFDGITLITIGRVPLHLGKLEHPQKRLPTLGPWRALRCAIVELRLGQFGIL